MSLARAWKRLARSHRKMSEVGKDMIAAALGALKDAGVSWFEPFPPPMRGSRMISLAEQIRRLAAERDAARAIVRDLARAEPLYDSDGDCAHCGRAWSLDAARHAATCPWRRAQELTR